MFKKDLENSIINDDNFNFFEGYIVDFNTQLVNTFGENTNIVLKSN